MHLATKTMAAIDAALEKDQGAAFRKWLGELITSAGDAFNPNEETFRSHLGASILGNKCARAVWYSFHWVTAKRVPASVVRLFNRGHLEEPRFVAMLKMIGCEVWQVDENGKQYKILDGYKGHEGGSLDGVVRGIPDMPDIPMLAEFKTHGEKSFKKLVDEGVMGSKWEHFVQMQRYMGNRKLTHALYCAVNKNTDELHIEIVQFDPTQYEKYGQRVIDIIDSANPPPRISKTAAWYDCKFCDHSPVCHGNAAPERNCRTCDVCYAHDHGEFLCFKSGEGVPLTKEQQLSGCGDYKLRTSIKQ